MKYRAYVTYRQTGILDIEADNEEEAKEIAFDRADEAEETGDDDYEVEIEELDE